MSSSCSHTEPLPVPIPEHKDVKSPPVTYPVPFGHVPYTPSLPEVMGPLWGYPIEWWYYAGWAMNTDKTKNFTILFQTVRASQSQQQTAATIMYGIGIDNPSSFHTNLSVGTGNFPNATSTSWSTEATTASGNMTCGLKGKSGSLGLPGSVYELQMNDTKKNVSVSLAVKDNFGMILEGPSGSFHKGGTNSIEVAMPSLKIESGTIKMNEETFKLSSGNIWLDRQTITVKNSVSHLKSDAAPPLYIGNWLAVIMNDNTVYNFTFFWPKKTPQWIVGSKLDQPVEPLQKNGIEYMALPNWGLGGNFSPMNGVNVLNQDEFDLNLLIPHDPASSPHWESPTSKQTYSTAWQLKIKDHLYTVEALVQESEVFLGTYFFEGAASMKDESGHEVGRVFVEEMGYN